MNETQRRYAKKRVSDIAFNAISSARREFESISSRLSYLDVYNQIKDKKPKKPSADKLKYLAYASMNLGDFFDFKIEISPTKKQQESFDKRVEKINRELNRCVDNIMLGGCKEVSQIISDFEKMIS